MIVINRQLLTTCNHAVTKHTPQFPSFESKLFIGIRTRHYYAWRQPSHRNTFSDIRRTAYNLNKSILVSFDTLSYPSIIQKTNVKPIGIWVFFTSNNFCYDDPLVSLTQIDYFLHFTKLRANLSDQFIYG